MNTQRMRNDWGAPPPAHVRGPAPRRRRGRKGLVLLVLVLLPLVFGGWLWFHVDSSINRISAFPDYSGRPAAGAGTNWLVVGSDSRDGLDPETAETLISIPRDSQVPVPGHGRTMINAAFALGGPELLAQTVEQATGLRIDHYAEIGFGGFAGLVDAVGGVELCLDREMHDTKTGQTLQAGCQTLDGEKALTFVRMRYSDATPRSDLDRVANQRKFIGALVEEASSFGTLINPFRTYALADRGAGALTMLEPDGPGDLLSLAWAMRGISSGGVVTTTVPVTDASAHRWDKQKAGELFEAVNNDQPIREDLIVE